MTLLANMQTGLTCDPSSPAHAPGMKTPTLLLTAALLIAGLTGCSAMAATTTTESSVGSSTASSVPPTSTAAPSAAPTSASAASSAGRTLAVLATLPVKGRAPKTGYDRVGDFGAAWADVDHNGCDTRDDILARDLTAVTKSGTCKVLTGTLNDPYTGKVIHFVRGMKTSLAVQIDHQVALMNAWQTGAQQMTPAARVMMANDPLNLFAVDGPSNEQKSDSDAASWLPVKSYRCAYVTHQIDVKAKYGLWVTPAERDAMVRVLGSC